MTTAIRQPAIEHVDPSEPTILVRVSPSTVADEALAELREISTPQELTSDCLRSWLRSCVDAEIARRATDGESEEPAAWLLPWHQWNDDQLRAALVCSWSLLDISDNPIANSVLREVHRASVTAAATRLGELHDAIQRTRGR